MRHRSLAVAALLVLAAPPTLAAQSPAPADESAIVRLARDYETAWAKADAKAIAALFTPDAVALGVDGKVSTGRAAIERTLAEQFATAFKGTTIRIHTASSRALKPDVALGRGTFDVLTKGKVTMSGFYATVHVKGADGWKITSNAAYVAPPTPTPAPAAAKKA